MTPVHCESEASWLMERTKSIGSSDAPSLFGMGFNSAFRVAMEKIGKAPSKEKTDEMEMGVVFEPAIRELFSRRTGNLVGRCPHVIFRHDNGFMHASLDGVVAANGQSNCDVKNPNGGLECKMSNEPPSEWTEGAPLRLALEIQAQHAMACTGLKWFYAAVLCTHFRQTFLMFRVDRNEAFIEKLIKKERQFWEEIHAGIFPAPNASAEDHRLIRHLHPKDDGTSVLLSDVKHVLDFEEWLLAEKSRTEWEAREWKARNALELAIGDHTRAVLANGVRLSLRGTKDGKRVLRREWEKR